MFYDKLKPPPDGAVQWKIARSSTSSVALCVACAFICTSGARADVIFSNLGPDDSFQQFSSNDVRGPGSLAGNQDLAGSFTVGSSASLLDNVEVAFSSGSGSVNVQVWSDSSGIPGAVLASTLVTDLPNDFPPEALTTVDLSHAELTLAANTKYWLVADADGTSNLFWHYNDTGHEGFGVRTNGGWSSFSSFNAPAFRINGPGGGSTVDGDFNSDGSVDAADYVVWRRGDGSVYDHSHYTLWRQHFGATSAGAGMTGAAIPEPQSLVLACWFCCGWICRRRIA